MKIFNHGLVLGKFMPAHEGHLHLIRFATNMCERLTIVVDRVEGEAPDASIRADYLRKELEGMNSANISRRVYITALGEYTPQDPSETPEFWSIWKRLLTRACGGVPDALVCSMDYGQPLSRAMGEKCHFLPLDIARHSLAISSTMIRDNPWEHWDMILPSARHDYLTRVAIEGPESTGKTTISLKCAEEFGFTYAPEWAAGYIASRVDEEFREEDLLTIAMAQTAMEHSLDLSANKALICDSSLLTTMIWSEFLYGRVDPKIVKLFETEEASRPKTRWLMTPDTPWVNAPHRNIAEKSSAE
jgi:NadR type nicotinamide-nucleotide adenylyltransferase